MNKKRIFLLLILTLVVLFFLGDSPSPPEFTFKLPEHFPKSILEAESFVKDHESQFRIKEDNESRIVWANPDSISKTEYAIVYLHGFSASPGEGMPIHTDMAKAYGMNLYVPRLDQHGLITDEALLEFTTEGFIESAYEAIKLGELLGEKVIVMSCSTGGTASLYAVAETNVNVHAQVMYSPNIDIFDPKASLLTIPWGLQLARIVKGSDDNDWSPPEAAKQYWYDSYRLEAVVQLKNMVNETMCKETFNKVSVPSFIGYYYKNEAEQDSVVSIEATRNMIAELHIHEDSLMAYEFKEVGKHALQSQFFSKDLATVREQTELFFTQVLGIKKPLP